MGRITRFTGGQTVTDPSGSGERNIVFSNNAIDDTTGFVSGNIYLTPSESTQFSEITGFSLVTTPLLATEVNVSFQVVGDVGASFFIRSSDGINSVQYTIVESITIPSVEVISGQTFEVPNIVNANTTINTKDVTFTINAIVADDAETRLADSLTPSVSLSQAAGLLDRNVTASPTSGTAEVSAFFDDITFTWLGGGQGSVSVSGQNPAGSSSFTTVGRITGNSPFFDLNVQADGTYDGIGSPVLNSGGNIDMRMDTSTADITGDPPSYDVRLTVSLPETSTHAAGSASCTITYTQ